MSLDQPSLRALERQLQPAPEDRLAALERVWRRFADAEALLKRGGRVIEVTPTHYKVHGLSGFARLGDIVEQRGDAGARRGEIVKIGRDEAVVAPFERSADSGIGDAVFRRGPLVVAPHASWRGRTIDALTRTIDGGPPLARGDDTSRGAQTITRFAHALREVATGTGEPPVARGYPASVFTELPKLLERAGPGGEGKGSITAIISVLVDGDDHNDPVADSVRGILDGHVVLDRTIAEQGRYPPVNPLSSISRLAGKAWSVEQRALVTRLKSMISRFEDTRDIRLLGAYQGGADAELDIAVRQVPLIYEALTQAPKDRPSTDPFSDLARHLKSKLNADAGD
ncbi:MAG: hypothetical protein E5Y29_20050 [Mesorhizobium sp.]|nr:MAG: hypothetical protein E5Y29_20050 [Mesorhizobium sp.]